MVLFQCLSEDQDIIQIYYHNALSYEILENVIHHGLEDSQTIGYAKEYYQRLEKTVASAKDSLPFISGLNTDIVETPANIQFGKVLGFLELGHKLGD